MLKPLGSQNEKPRNHHILLVDEPFSGLDPLSTRLIESLLVRINRERGMTMIVVSHHIASTMRMADQVLLLLPDAAVQGSPAQLKASPDPRVRRFLADESETDAEVLAAAADLERHAHAPSGAAGPGGVR